MSILDILEAHRTLASAPDDKVCACDRTWRPDAEYRAHVAQVLEQHVLEAKAEALEEAADEIERLENIGDTAQGELNEEQTAEYWLYHGTPKTTWLRDLAAQIRSQS